MGCGFIILNYNSYKLTRDLSKLISTFTNIDKVIIVDNMSTDNSYEKLKRLENNKVIVCQSGKNGGYSYGNNVGAKICRRLGFDYLFIANPDITIDEENFNRIYNSLINSGYDMLSGVEYDIEDKISKPIVWETNTYYDDLLYCFTFTRYIKKKLEKNKQFECINGIYPCDIIRGSFFGIKTSAFFDVGGFDENVFLFCEERILGYKLKNNNFRMGIVADAKYNHNHSATINKEYKAVRKKIKLLYESRLYFYKEYLHVSKIKIILMSLAMKISYIEFYFMDKSKELLYLFRKI